MEKVLKSRYEVLKSVGFGGMSEVSLALDLQTRQTVAVKVMDRKLTQDASYVRRFNQELAIARLLDHPGIPRLIDDGQTEEGVPFLVLEYVQGITLTEYLRKKGPLPIEEAVAIASSVLTILSYAYSKGIQAHRDIKPGNIMIDLRTHAVTVMDFGIAKTVGSSLTHSTVLYTPRYAAPEQLLPSKFGGVVDKRADLYALGVVLYEMLTGRVPFTGETPAEISGEQITSPPPSPSSIRRDIPAPLSQVLLTCLQANPSHRYQTPQDLLQDLRAGHVGETKQIPAPARERVPVAEGEHGARRAEEDRETLIRTAAIASVVSSGELIAAPKKESPQPAPQSGSRVPVALIVLALVVLIPLAIMLARGAKSEPPVAVTATLTITSTPPGAQVSLNGTSVGTTPIMKRAVTPGTYTVLLTLAGYDDYTRSVLVQAGDTRLVSAPLTKKAVNPATATLTITSSPPGAQIYLGGTRIGTTPTARSVAPGTYTILLTLAGYGDYRVTTTLHAGDAQPVDAPLTKKTVTPTTPAPTTGTLTVSSYPSSAHVYVDGKDTYELTPATFILSPESYNVRLTREGYYDGSGSAVIVAGKTTDLHVTLIKTSPLPPAKTTLTITSTPIGAQVFLNQSSIGTTPTVETVDPGTYALLFTLAGYEDYRETITLQAGTPRTVTALLTKAPVVPTTATLTITSMPPGAQVYLNGTSMGSTPVTNRTVNSGTYTVLLTLAGYEDYRETITLRAGFTRQVDARLTKTPATTALAIGDAYQGGIVAYILQPGDPGYSATVQHGLIVATADQSTGILWALAAYQNTSVIGTLITLGSGSANTDKIIAQNGPGSGYAAGLARAYQGGGYTDWYLPSRDEFDKLWDNLVWSRAPHAIAGLADGVYWTSSEGDAAGVWSLNSRIGHQYLYSSKNSSFRVRAVRSF